MLQELSAQGANARGLLMFWLDGVFASASEQMVGSYLGLYLLALGASGQQVGLLSSMPALAGAAMLLPGARLAARFPNYRNLIVLTSLAGRSMLALMAIVPLIVHGQAVIAAIIILAALRAAGSQLGVPAWTALSALVAPPTIRGRYFSLRTASMNLAAMVAVPIAGALIAAVGSPLGYQVTIGLAFAAGLLASWTLVYIPFEPSVARAQRQAPSLRRVLRLLPGQPAFLRLCLVAITINLAVPIAGPFFNVYLVRDLGASPSYVGILTTVQTGAILAATPFWGRLMDRRGLRWVMVRSTPLIAFIPFGWLLVREPWQALPIAAVGEIGWAGYGLAVFSYLLASTPDEDRPTYSAFYNIGVALAGMLGPILGGFMYDQWGFHANLTVSFVGRSAAALLVFLLINEVGNTLNREADPAGR